jgi:hypothetical protein
MAEERGAVIECHDMQACIPTLISQGPMNRRERNGHCYFSLPEGERSYIKSGADPAVALMTSKVCCKLNTGSNDVQTKIPGTAKRPHCRDAIARQRRSQLTLRCKRIIEADQRRGLAVPATA